MPFGHVTYDDPVEAAGLPGWPFLGQISKIGLVSSCLAGKILVGYLAFFGLISSWLALKNLFGLLALFWPFFAEIGSIGSCDGKHYYSMLLGNTIGKFLW